VEEAPARRKPEDAALVERWLAEVDVGDLVAAIEAKTASTPAAKGKAKK
jgi:hypothetical protein